jgi:predicted DNA-binding transcriptional regulator AlpA
MNLTEALAQIRAQTTMSDEQYDLLVSIVAERANGSDHVVVGTRDTVCGPQERSWTMPRTAKLLNRADIAKLLGSPPITIYKWFERSRLPKPDAWIGNRPVWNRKTISRFCDDLIQLDKHDSICTP